MTKQANSKTKGLSKRVAKLEQTVKAHHSSPTANGGSSTTKQADSGKQKQNKNNGNSSNALEDQLLCTIPETDERQMAPGVSEQREELIRYTARKWANGTVLHYYFFNTGAYGGPASERDLVREGFAKWRDVGLGLRFEEVTNIGQAEIRIGFLPGDGYWSYVGTDVLNIGQQERTMNFGQDLASDSRGSDVAVHEIGHTLGFPHEHQNPLAGIVWNEDAVKQRFSGPPNFWDEAKIQHNILRKIPQGEIDGSAWDPDSIMHYGFPKGLIEAPSRYQHQPLEPAPGLSSKDEVQARFFYPELGDPLPTLERFKAAQLNLAPGEQADYRLEPPATGDYDIQSFGGSDSVMVLFEDRGNDDYVYVAGDDDSGWNRNAHINVRLYHDRKYVLRVRLYYQWDSGGMAVMYW